MSSTHGKRDWHVRTHIQGGEKFARRLCLVPRHTWETSAAGRIILKLDLKKFEKVLTGFG
jgi:hypothetical protein